MVRKLSISPEDSVLSLPTKEDEKEVTEADILSSPFPQWSSKFKCLEAYVCAIFGFTCVMDQCRVLKLYGSAIFPMYFVLTISIGVPTVFVEIFIGRYVMGNVYRAWSMCPFGKGVLVCLFGTTLYAVVINHVCTSYLLKYLISFYRGFMPWNECREPWARENCYVIRNNGTSLINCYRKYSIPFCNNLSWETTGTQYWKYAIGSKTDVKHLCFAVACSFFTMFCVVLINIKGHRSCEKVFTFLVVVPVLSLLVLTFAAYTSLGAIVGLSLILKLNWNKLFSLSAWMDVFLHFVSCLSVGTLSLSFISSHGKFNDNIFIDTLVVNFTVFITPSLVALPVLSIFEATKFLFINSPLASYFQEMGMDNGVVSVLIAISEALLSYPSPNIFWGFLFYIQLVLLSMGTQAVFALALCEVITSVLSQKNFICSIISVGTIIFILSMPHFFFEFDITSGFNSIVASVIFLYALTLQLFYGYKKFNEDFHFMMGYLPSIFFFRIFWIIVIPITLIVILHLMYNNLINYKSRNDYIYITIPLVIYVFVALVQIIRAAKKGAISSAFVADPDWGPDNAILKMSRVIFDTRTITKEFIYRRELFRKHLVKPPTIADQNIVQLI